MALPIQHSTKLSSHQSGPNIENLFSQQQISEIMTPHYRNHPRAGSEEKPKVGGPEVLACL